jgi:adenylylsulfate kinase
MGDERLDQGWAVWIVGLPGSGKSNLARWLHETLLERGEPVRLLQMDQERARYKALLDETDAYSEAGRLRAYALFVQEAASLAARGLGVLMDGAAYKTEMRQAARRGIPHFAEIHVKCALEVAMRREARRPQGLVMADLYRKALERKATGRTFEGLGQVVGVDVPFEEDPAAELVIDNTWLRLADTRDLALAFLDAWLASWRT